MYITYIIALLCIK